MPVANLMLSELKRWKSLVSPPQSDGAHKEVMG